MGMVHKLQEAMAGRKLLEDYRDRERKASEAAGFIANNMHILSKSLKGMDPKMEAAVIALKELAEFQGSLRSALQAIAGHSMEDSKLAEEHARDMVDVATLALNMDEVLAPTPYEINNPEDVYLVLSELSKEIEELASEGKPIKVGLVVRMNE